MQRPYDDSRRISENTFHVRQFERERRIDRHIGERLREDRGSTKSGDWRSSPSSYPSVLQPRVRPTAQTPTDNYDYRPYVNENSGRGEIARLYHRAARFVVVLHDPNSLGTYFSYRFLTIHPHPEVHILYERRNDRMNTNLSRSGPHDPYPRAVSTLRFANNLRHHPDQSDSPLLYL
jgi:hypothetical protein